MYVCGGLNPSSFRAREHALNYYESVRNNKSDYYSIALNTGFSIEQIQMIKNYIFRDTHYIRDSKGYAYRRFHPSFEMADSWRRLKSKGGNLIQKHDILLLQHELLEMQGIIRNNSVLLDAELDYYYYGCGYLECEMRKDKFLFIFNSLIQGGRLYYSVNNI